MASGNALTSIYEEIRLKGIAEERVFTYKILTYDNVDIDKRILKKGNVQHIL